MGPDAKGKTEGATALKPFYQDEITTIYHGDARKIVPALGPVDFIFTDPPYGHNNNDGDSAACREATLGKHKACAKPRPIRGDSPGQASDLVQWLFREAASRLRASGCCCCCCCGGGGPDPQFARWSLWMDQHLNFKQMVVWDKGPIGMGWHYRRSYETVLVAQNGKGKTRWYDRTHAIENIIRPGAHGIRKIIPRRWDHPTPKPPALAAHFIRLHTRRGQLVLDPFMGGGSTLLAARQLGRRSIGIEIDKRWCRMAARKLQEANG